MVGGGVERPVSSDGRPASIESEPLCGPGCGTIGLHPYRSRPASCQAFWTGESKYSIVARRACAGRAGNQQHLFIQASICICRPDHFWLLSAGPKAVDVITADLDDQHGLQSGRCHLRGGLLTQESDRRQWHSGPIEATLRTQRRPKAEAPRHVDQRAQVVRRRKLLRDQPGVEGNSVQIAQTAQQPENVSSLNRSANRADILLISSLHAQPSSLSSQVLHSSNRNTIVDSDCSSACLRPVLV